MSQYSTVHHAVSGVLRNSVLLYSELGFITYVLQYILLASQYLVVRNSFSLKFQGLCEGAEAGLLNRVRARRGMSNFFLICLDSFCKRGLGK
jgi:hypothetical protein